MSSIVRLLLLCVLASCVHGVHVNKSESSVIELINDHHKKRIGIKATSAFNSFDRQVYQNREHAVKLYSIPTDTTSLKRFIVIDIVSFEGGKSTYGEVIVNDTSKYYYKSNPDSKAIEKYDYPIESEKTILDLLVKHRFNDLEELADQKGKDLSGSNFFYIGMYEKGMDSIYVKLLPAFIVE